MSFDFVFFTLFGICVILVREFGVYAKIPKIP